MTEKKAGDTAAESDNELPFPKGWPVVAGALAGIALRLAFRGAPGETFAAMSAGFMYLAPIVVGAVTVYVAERRTRRDWNYYVVAPFLANCLFILGTLLIMIEGLICAIVVVPLFGILGSVGGVLMGAVCRLTNWPKQTLYSIGLLPFIVGGLYGEIPASVERGAVERRVLIAAAADEIWNQILNAPDIRPEEIEGAWMFRIGVPLTRSGRMLETEGGRVRRVTMGNGIYFDELITDLRPPSHVRWTYRYHEDSFPPGTLDEHVRLGGHYFDITDTSYTLTPRDGRTELAVTMHYRLSTSFNWYAVPVARLLLRDLAGVNLDYYRHRAEGAAAGMEPSDDGA